MWIIKGLVPSPEVVGPRQDLLRAGWRYAGVADEEDFGSCQGVRADMGARHERQVLRRAWGWGAGMAGGGLRVEQVARWICSACEVSKWEYLVGRWKALGSRYRI